jgi:hypothetical protein
MSRCFNSGSSNLSAKEYTYKKRNRNMFCDLRTKFIANGLKTTGTTDACINHHGILSHFKNKTTQLQIKKGYEEFLYTNVVDMSNNRPGQQIKEYFCSPYNIDISNVDISNNYGGMILTAAVENHTAQTIVVDSSGTYVNRYAEIISTDNGSPFQSGKQTIYTNCPIRNNGRIQVITADELAAPEFHSFEIVLN